MFTFIIVVLEIVVFLLVMIPLLLVIFLQSGFMRSLFFEIETGNTGFVDTGSSNEFTYLNDPGYILVDGRTNPVEIDGVTINDWARVPETYPGQSEKEKTYIQKNWGFYWVGFRFLNRKVHTIPVTKKKANSELRPNMPPEEWITGSGDVVAVNSLRSVFPRPVLVPDMKFKDGIEANLLLNCDYEVLVPRRPVYSLKGDFFSVVEAYTRTGMKDVVQDKTADEFKNLSQVEGSPMSNNIVARINKKLIEVCGIGLKGVSIPIYNLSSEQEERATKAAEIARLEGLGRIAQAQAEAQVSEIQAERSAANKVIDATAEAKADNIRNEASITDVTIATEKLVAMGVHPDMAVAHSAAVARATRFSHPDSKVTTLLDGHTPIAVTPERREGGR